MSLITLMIPVQSTAKPTPAPLGVSDLMAVMMSPSGTSLEFTRSVAPKSLARFSFASSISTAMIC